MRERNERGREEGDASLFTYGACVRAWIRARALFLPVLCASRQKGKKKKGKKKNRNRREENDDSGLLLSSLCVLLQLLLFFIRGLSRGRACGSSDATRAAWRIPFAVH